MEVLLGNENRFKPCQDNATAIKSVGKLMSIAYTDEKDVWLSACPVPCRQIRYDANIRYFHKSSFLEPTNSYGNNFSATCILLSISYETLLTEDHEESLVYDLTNFLAAAGGNLGLFLGFSCMSIFYGMIKFVKKIKLQKHLIEFI